MVLSTGLATLEMTMEMPMAILIMVSIDIFVIFGRVKRRVINEKSREDSV